MARQVRTYVEVTDDLDGKMLEESEAVNVQFSYGGKQYELDTSKPNKEQMDQIMQRFIDAGRIVKPQTAPSAPSRPQTGQNRQGGGGGRQSPHSPLSGTEELSDHAKGKQRQAELSLVRQWAVDQGMNQGRIGKVRRDIIHAYNRAHNTSIPVAAE